MDKRVEKLRNSKAHTCVGVRIVSGQVEMPIQGFDMISVQTFGFLQTNNSHRNGIEYLRKHFELANAAECFDIPGVKSQSAVGRSHCTEAGRRMGEAVSLNKLSEKEGVRSAARKNFCWAGKSSLRLMNTNLHPFRGGQYCARVRFAILPMSERHWRYSRLVLRLVSWYAEILWKRACSDLNC